MTGTKLHGEMFAKTGQLKWDCWRVEGRLDKVCTSGQLRNFPLDISDCCLFSSLRTTVYVQYLHGHFF